MCDFRDTLPESVVSCQDHCFHHPIHILHLGMWSERIHCTKVHRVEVHMSVVQPYLGNAAFQHRHSHGLTNAETTASGCLSVDYPGEGGKQRIRTQEHKDFQIGFVSISDGFRVRLQ